MTVLSRTDVACILGATKAKSTLPGGITFTISNINVISYTHPCIQAPAVPCYTIRSKFWLLRRRITEQHITNSIHNTRTFRATTNTTTQFPVLAREKKRKKIGIYFMIRRDLNSVRCYICVLPCYTQTNIFTERERNFVPKSMR